MRRSIVWLCFAALFGCSLGEGSTDIQINMSALSAADVTRVNVTITGSGMSPMSRNLSLVNGVWKGTIGAIPVGTDRIFTANAFNSASAIIYSGQSAPTTITRNNTTVVLLTLQQVNAPPPFANAAPVISSFTASSNSAVAGDIIELSAVVQDPNGDPLTLYWSATGGTFSSQSASSTQWTAPVTDGDYTISLSATDNKSATNGVALQINVSAANGKGRAQVTTIINTWPEILLVNATPAQVDVGQTTSISVQATDADANPLTYSWSADCAGSFSNSSAQNPTFTLSAPLPLDGSCTVSVSVSDGRGGSNVGSFTLVTGPITQANIAPEVELTFQSETSIFGGESVLFSVEASDAESTALSFAWSAASGAFGIPSNTATSSEIVWTSLDCNAPQVFVSAEITDGFGLSTTETFTVDVSCICGNSLVEPNEECDDGNAISGDGCSASCQFECGDGSVHPGEECDDGNAINGDGCSSSCQYECDDPGNMPVDFRSNGQPPTSGYGNNNPIAKIDNWDHIVNGNIVAGSNIQLCGQSLTGAWFEWVDSTGHKVRTMDIGVNIEADYVSWSNCAGTQQRVASLPPSAVFFAPPAQCLYFCVNAECKKIY